MRSAQLLGMGMGMVLYVCSSWSSREAPFPVNVSGTYWLLLYPGQDIACALEHATRERGFLHLELRLGREISLAIEVHQTGSWPRKSDFARWNIAERDFLKRYKYVENIEGPPQRRKSWNMVEWSAGSSDENGIWQPCPAAWWLDRRLVEQWESMCLFCFDDPVQNGVGLRLRSYLPFLLLNFVPCHQRTDSCESENLNQQLEMGAFTYYFPCEYFVPSPNRDFNLENKTTFVNHVHQTTDYSALPRGWKRCPQILYKNPLPNGKSNYK